MDPPASPGSPGSPGSPSSSKDSLSPIPSPVNLTKDPDFLPPDDENGHSSVPTAQDAVTTPLKSPPPVAYDQKIVKSNFTNHPS